MRVIDLQNDAAGTPESRSELLERGNILLFPKTPFTISADHRSTLFQAGQADGNFHKNISYKPASGRISGLGPAADGEAERVKAALRSYSQASIQLLEQTVTPYQAKWKPDYASFRSIEEEGRQLPLKKRNDLLHTDAFPTRPTNGGLILRIFTNLNPTEDRVWVTGDPFADIAPAMADAAGLRRLSSGGNAPLRGFTKALHALGLPVVDRSPYDEFMLGFHDYLKGNGDYQKNAVKYQFRFPPDSTWIVFTDVVPHSVIAGRYALEQTMIIARESLVCPECAPVSILEKLCQKQLVSN